MGWGTHLDSGLFCEVQSGDSISNPSKEVAQVRAAGGNASFCSKTLHQEFQAVLALVRVICVSLNQFGGFDPRKVRLV